MNQDWNVIFSYTRKQAIEDGVLIDVTDQAKQMGFKVNTVVTDHLFGDYLAPPAGPLPRSKIFLALSLVEPPRRKLTGKLRLDH